MNQEEQGKKTSPTEKLPAGKDDKAPVPGNSAALSDADLDNVAAGRDRGGFVIIQRKSIDDDYRDSSGKCIDAN